MIRRLVTGDRPRQGCEGRCGVTLYRVGDRWLEGAAVDLGPGHVEFLDEHTPRRCRVIRTLRETVERSIPDSDCEIHADGPDIIFVRGARADRFVEMGYRMPDLLAASAAQLAATATHCADNIEAVLDRRAKPIRDTGARPACLLATDPRAAP